MRGHNYSVGKYRRAKLSNQGPFVVLLLPFLIAFVVFQIIPMLSAIVLSFTDYNLLKINNFVGLENYLRIFFDDEIFTIALKNTLVLALITGPAGFILSFVIAWFINELSRFTRTIVTFIIYSPTLAGNIYVIWKYIFSSDSRGFLNDILLKVGLISAPISWLTDSTYNYVIVIIVTIWMSFGAGFLSFVSGLKALDHSYYEAAAVDGLKNRWQELYYVTFPQMGPQLLFGAVNSISSAFAVGTINAELTGNPSADYSTHTILLHMTDHANARYEMGYACALAVILFAMMIASWFLIKKVIGKFNG